MKRYISALAIVAAVAGVTLVALPSTGWCIKCNWTGDCYNDKVCGKTCACVKRDTIDVAGYCAVR